jgi:membrane-associated protease RseP (regulator of RpoE activity)
MVQNQPGSDIASILFPYPFSRTKFTVKPNNLILHVVLFFLTFFSLTFREGIFFIYEVPIEKLRETFFTELPYSASLIIILLAHEMGHYLPARYYGLNATLPYFIPFPMGPIGTMGAVIKINDVIPDKKKLFDIGMGGPLMSFILSIPCWLIGIYLSDLKELDPLENMSNYLFFGDSFFTYWSAQLIHGPYNPATHDIVIHPLARAGWVGLIITAINLLPFGQLDGGHIIYSLFGERYRNWIYHLFLFFILMALVSFTWVIWAFLIYFLVKVEHPFVEDAPVPLSKGRKYLGYFMLIALFFIFVPSPMSIGSSSSRDNLLLELWSWLG